MFSKSLIVTIFVFPNSFKASRSLTPVDYKWRENAFFGFWDHPAAIAAPLQRRGIIPSLEGQGWLIQNNNLYPFSELSGNRHYILCQGEEEIVLWIPANLDPGMDDNKFRIGFQQGDEFFVIRPMDLVRKVRFTDSMIQIKEQFLGNQQVVFRFVKTLERV